MRYILKENLPYLLYTPYLNNGTPSKTWIIKVILLATLESNTVSAYFAIHTIYLWLKLRLTPSEPSHSQPTPKWRTCWFNPYLLLCLDFSRSFSLSFLCSLCLCSRSLCLSLCLWESATIKDESVKRRSDAISCPPTLMSWSRSTMTGFK